MPNVDEFCSYPAYLPILNKTLHMLTEFYRPYNTQLFELLGRPMVGWASSEGGVTRLNA